MAAGDRIEDRAEAAQATATSRPRAATGAGDSADDAPAGVPRSRLADELREGRAPPTVVAALIAWSITIAPVGFARGATFVSALLAVLALAAGVAGPLVARTRARAGRHLGISLFTALATLVWLLGSSTIHPIRLDPLRGAFGAIAWGVFALSWSDRWGSAKADPVPADPEAPALLARATLPELALPVAAMGVAVALGYITLAWRVREPDRALVAQAVGLLCAVGVVTASATVAIARGKKRPSTGRRLTPPAVRALLLLVTVAIAGAVITALR